MLIHFNTYFIILATCFGYVIAIIRPTRTVELALDAALPDDGYDVAVTCRQYNKVCIKVY
jgi:hypothetical protein